MNKLHPKTLLRFLAPVLLVAATGIFLLHIAFRQTGSNSRPLRTRAEIDNIKVALGLFEVNTGHFPATAEGLRTLVGEAGQIPRDLWGKAYLEYLPHDAWGREFRYACPPAKSRDTEAYEISSAGADGRFGTRDDIAVRGRRYGAAQKGAESRLEGELGVEWLLGLVVIAAGVLVLHGLRQGAQTEMRRRLCSGVPPSGGI